MNITTRIPLIGIGKANMRGRSTDGEGIVNYIGYDKASAEGTYYLPVIIGGLTVVVYKYDSERRAFSTA